MNVGFTYEIRDKSNPDLVYYGSSELSALEDRMKIHLDGFKHWKKTGAGYCSSFKVLELNNFKETLLKIVFFSIKWELREQERHLIEYQTCVNENIPNRTKAEWYQANREKIKEYQTEYQAENKEKIKEYQADYYQANIEQIKEYYQDNKEKIKEYQTENKEKIKEYQSEYRVENRDKIKQTASKKFDCPCGGKYTGAHKADHNKSKRHQNWLKTQV